MPGGSVRARVQGHGGAHGGSSNEKACDIARGGGACAGARRIYLEFQHRLGLGLAPLLPLLRRVHAPLPVRLLSLLALPASLGWLRLVLAEPLPRNFGKCADHALFARSLRSSENACLEQATGSTDKNGGEGVGKPVRRKCPCNRHRRYRSSHSPWSPSRCRPRYLRGRALPARSASVARRA